MRLEKLTRLEGILERIRQDHLDAIRSLDLQQIANVAEIIAYSLLHGGKVLIFGCGGSAADAQHFAAELVWRFERTRGGFAAIALTTDTSLITAIANDLGFEEIFARQIETLYERADVAIGISTSGGSAAVNNALNRARENGITTVGFTRKITQMVKTLYRVEVDSMNTARIQEGHITAIHMICALLDDTRRD